MPEELVSLGFLLARYLHIIAAALLLGGTLFYELIVPVAIDDLKDEQKLWVFARARWAFRWLVWCTAVTLLLSGAVATYRNWYGYSGVEAAINNPDYAEQLARERLHIEGAGYWWLAHATGSLLGLGMALSLVKGRTPPRCPLVWMRINLLVLMLVIFLASTTRHVRLRLLESHLPPPGPNVVE